MLENEPDMNQTPTNGDQPAAAPPPRRRRAASRPAGPPATAADAPTIEKAPAVAQLDQPPVAPPSQASSQVETTAPEAQQAEVTAPPAQPQTEVAAAEVATADAAPLSTPPARKTAAKRPARKAAAKKTAAAPVDADTETPAPSVDDAVAEAPKKRAPRKRAVKKVAEPEPALGQQVDDSGQISVGVAATSDGAASAPAGWEAPSVGVEPTATAAPSDGVEPTAAVDPVSTTAAAEATVESDIQPPAAESTVIAPDLDAEDPELEDPETPEAEAAKPEAGEPEAGADPAVEAPRDFGWLADPFAAPRTSRTAEVAPTDDSALTDAAPVSAEDDSTSDDSDDASTDDSTSEDDDSGEGGGRRRRRRRGGRRRRRGGDSDSSDDSADSDDDEDEAPARGARAAKATSSDDDGKDESAAETASDDSGDESDGDDSQGQGRRRRRRRRRGEETAALPDDPAEVVVRVREPRARKKAASEEVTGIQGSTRMEAKRQRRKEGRDAGRRRAPILSEAEFLARRESVSRKMIIRQRADLTQIAVIEDGILVEHYVDRDSAASLIGNVYLGRVQNVLPSMEAAFVDIGRGRNAVLYAGEVDWDSFGADGHNRKVEKVLKSGQMILVQVSKDPVGAKGARLTNHVSIPGRYVVYAPGGHLSGISRKLPDVERRRLKDILADLVGSNASVIVRTAAEGASEEELVRDVNRLKAQWEDIERKVKAGNSPQLLYGEPDLTVRIVRDLFTEDFSDLIIQGNGSMNDAYDAIQGYVTHVAPHLQERIHRWEPQGDTDLFSEYRLDEQIAKALERKVFLPSGGSLVIDRTEAMTVIDVNTGKFTGTGGNLEATVTSNNLEAAEEIVNQLRLRDIGGIIVIDFIDMVLPANRELLLRRLVECLGRDRTRHQVAEVTSLGLVQMTRKKIGTGLLEAFGTECPTCHGRGYELHDLPVDTQQQADGGTRDQRPQARRQHPNDGPKPGAGTRGDSSRNDRGSGGDRSGRSEAGTSEAKSETEQVEVSTPRPGRNRGRSDHANEAAAGDLAQDEASTDEASTNEAGTNEADASVAALRTDASTTAVAEVDSGVEATSEVSVGNAEPSETAAEAVVPEQTTPVADHPADVVEATEDAAAEAAPVHRGLGTRDPDSPETSGGRGGRQHNDSVHDVPLDDEPGSYGSNGDQSTNSRSRRGRRGGRGGGGSGSRDQGNRDQGNRDQGNGSSRDQESQPAPTS